MAYQQLVLPTSTKFIASYNLWRVLLPSFLFLLLGVGAIITILMTAASRQDRSARDDSAMLLQNALAREHITLSRLAIDLSESETLTPTLPQNSAHLHHHLKRIPNLAAAFWLDGRDHLLAVYRAGQSQSRQESDDVLAAFSGGLPQLLARGRDGQTATGLLRWDTEIVFAAVAPSNNSASSREWEKYTTNSSHISENINADSASENKHVIILVRRLDAAFLYDIGSFFGLNDVRWHKNSDSAGGFLPLFATDHSELGGIIWSPERPGRTMLNDTVWMVSAILGIMLVLGAMALYHAHRAAIAVVLSGQRLTESENRFRSFAEAASDWLWESGADNNYTFFSDRFAATLGQSPQQILGNSLRCLADWAVDVETAARLRHALATQGPFRNVEIRLQATDGEERFLRLGGQPVLDSHGVFRGYRGTGVDVTREVQAARESERIRDLLTDAVESISEGFVLFGADDRLVVCNARYRAAYPLLADCLVPGVTFTEVLRVAAQRGGYHEAMNDLASWVAERLARHMHQGQPTDHRLGDARWYRISERATRSGGVVKILTDITELKSHEEAIAAKTYLLQAIFDNVAQGVRVSDAQGNLLAWNANFINIFVYPESFVQVGAPLATLEQYDLARGVQATDIFDDGEIIEGGTVDFRRRVRELVISDDRVIECRESPMPEGGIVATYTDITERKRFEHVLAELSQAISRNQGRLFFQSLLDSLMRALAVDIAFVAAYNPVAQCITTVAVRVDGREEVDVRCPVQHLPAASLPDGDEALFVPCDLVALLPAESPLAVWGAETYFGKTLLDSANEPIGIIAVMTRAPLERPSAVRTLLDIFAVRAAAELERLHTETALLESESRYRQLVELAPYGIIVWDGQHVIFANAMAARIFSVTNTAALEGQSLLERFRPFVDAHFLDRLSNPLCATEDDGKLVEVRALSDSGDTVELEVGLYRFSHNGRPVSLVMFNDITHRKRAESALQHAHKMQAIGELAGGVAHEFNNMLTAIGGFAHMVRRSLSDTPRIEYCAGEIIKASDRAASLTTQLLSFSRRTSKENIKRFAIGALMDDLRNFLRPVLGETVDVAFTVEDREALVEADPGLLHQAIVNLAINGRDAMPGGGTITITARKELASQAFRDRHPDLVHITTWIVIIVRDTGTGIESDLIDRIFEPFFTTKEQGKGTGLGLPMVYTTVTRAGGAIEVTSEPGKGSSFTLFLPAMVEDAASGELRRPACDNEALTANVLLIEDEEQVRNFIRMTLEDVGLRVATAVDGQDGIEQFRKSDLHFDLVVSDLVMPRVGGLEVARFLDAEAPAVPLILMSGYAPERQALGLPPLEPGRRVFLGKPIDPVTLTAAVRDILAAAAVEEW